MWNRQQSADTGFRGCVGEHAGGFARALTIAALTTGMLLATATFALAAPDRDNNPPGPRGGPGTNWENPPGPRGGPGASPDAKPWRPWVRRRIHNPEQPSMRRRLHNAEQPWLRRRINNAQQSDR
ncbi:MAG: hypothetical protein ACE5FM_01790, partial [Methyloligellaceae bacterium]